MKKKSIVKALFLMAISLSALSSCKQQQTDVMGHDAHDDPYALEIDSSLAVLLKPTNQEVVSSLPVIRVQEASKLFSVEIPGKITYDTKKQRSLSSRVSGRIERLNVKYNYQIVQKGQLLMEIYSPELAAAQGELLLISANGDQQGLLQKSKQRLILLGMSAGQVETIIRTKQVAYSIPVYSPASGYILENLSSQNPTLGSMEQGDQGPSASPVMLREGQYVKAGQRLFTIYQGEDLLAEFSIPPTLTQEVNTGTSLLIQSKEMEGMLKATIGLIEPSLKNGENFSIARVYLPQSDFRPGQFVKANIPVFIKNGSWLPKKSVWQSGLESIVFKKEKGVFVPKSVKTGAIYQGQIVVLEDLSDWEIASNANYLVDSESFIRPQNKTE